MPEKLTQKNRELAIGKTPLGEEALLLVSMSGTEHLGRLFEYKLELVSENSQIKAEEIVGRNVTISLKLGGDKNRYFNGYISHFTQVTAYGRLAQYQATVVPWLWFLTRTADCRIYQDIKIPDIIKEVFEKHKLKDFEKSLSGSYSEKEYCVQYRETDFDFVSRLMEQEGIYYYFKHENGKHKLVLADSPSAHKSYPEFEELEYHAADKGTKTKGCVSDWVVETQLQPVSYTLTDFDFKDTKKDLEVRAKVSRKHEAAAFEIYDYPGKYTEADDGDGYARKRIEEIQAQFEVATADSDHRCICPGFTFKLTDHPRDDRNGSYLITSASYKIKGNEYFSSAEESGECVYSCKFTAIPKDQAFRTPRTTPRPTVSGPQTAIVVGSSGEEIDTDKYGRVKVKFHWDRYSKADGNSSCWIRVAQVWAGRNWGAIYTPRIGQEVIVDFLEGDPDQPIITGRVYNAQAMPPYDLPTNKTMSTLKSNSSKGGEGFNEIRFEDKKGEEQIFIHAEKNLDIRVKNDRFETIGNDRHLVVENEKFEQVKSHRNEFVEKNHLEEIGEDRNLTVKGKEAKEVGKSLSLTVKGDVTEVFKAKHSEETTSDYYLKAKNIVIEGMQNITLRVGTSHIAIESGSIEIKTSGQLKIEGTTTDVKGSAKTSIEGGAMTEVKGAIVKIN
ncbi:MAG: type VI secretion system tip protein TssI/VgrG [Sedimentisphaerales bacterium]